EREEFDPKQVRAGDTQIEACQRGRADQSPGKALPASRRRRQPEEKEVRCGAGALRFRRAGVALTVIEGIRATTALGIGRAVGVDRSKFPHEQNFVSWLGLCPQHRGSVGNISQRRMRRGANRAARALRTAAPGGHPAKNARGAFARRSPARGGGAQAVGATARKRAERVYRWLRYGPEYVRQSAAADEAAEQRRLVKSLSKQAARLGDKLVPATMAPGVHPP